MAPTISNLKEPIAIRSEYTVSSPTAIRVKQHDLSLSGGEFTVSKWVSDSGNPSDAQKSLDLLSVSGKVTTLHQRRHFRDPSGLPLFELASKVFGLTRSVNLPGSNSKIDSIAMIAPRYSWHKDKFDVYVKNAAANGEEAVLQVRGQDIWKLRTNVWFNGTLVMTVKRTDKITPYIPWKRPEWHVEIGVGMDSSLASLIVVYMADVLYHPSMPSSHNPKGQNEEWSSPEPALSEEKGKMH